MPPPPRPRPRRVGGGGSCGPGGGRAAALGPVGSGGICAFHAPSQRLALKSNPPCSARPPLARALSQPAPGIGLQDQRGSISVRGSPTVGRPPAGAGARRPTRIRWRVTRRKLGEHRGLVPREMGLQEERRAHDPSACPMPLLGLRTMATWELHPTPMHPGPDCCQLGLPGQPRPGR